MRDFATIGQTTRWLGKGGASLLLAMAVLGAGAGAAGAHGGNGGLVHSCIVAAAGGVKIVGADDSCHKNEVALDWPAVDTNTTYEAGSGLALSSTNVFSVTGAPWGGLTGVPSGFADNQDNVGDAWSGLSGIPLGFADGVDDVGQSVDMKSDDPSTSNPADDDGIKEPNDNDGFVHWNNLEAIPDSILRLRTLSVDDATVNEELDPVSFSKIKDLTSGSGGNADGRITSLFLKNGTITSVDLAGSDGGAFGTDIVAGAVTSEKIFDNTVANRDLGDGAVSAQKLVPSFLSSLVTETEFDAFRLAMKENDPSSSNPADDDGIKEPNDGDGFVHWNNLEDVPADIADGDAGEHLSLHTRPVDPQAAPAGERIAVTVDASAWPSGLTTTDIVTVSPPADLDRGLVFSGSDVLQDGELTIYLYNVSASVVDGEARDWRVRVSR